MKVTLIVNVCLLYLAQTSVASQPGEQRPGDPAPRDQMDTKVHDLNPKPDVPPPPYSASPAGNVNYTYSAEPAAPQTSNDATIDVGFVSTGLDNVSLRRGFIRKVYLILASQLAFTFSMVLITTLVGPIGQAIRDTYWVFYIALGVFIVVYISLFCSTKLRRQTPGNMIAMCVFTLAMTAMASTLAAFTSSNAVLVSMGITGAVCIGVTVFMLQTRVDFTVIASLVYGVLLVFVLFGLSCLVSFLVYRGRIDPMTDRMLDCVYGGLVALLLVVCLVVDTHQVIGGSGGYQLSEEEYVFGALQLYIDVVYILMIFMGLRGGR